MNATTVFEKSAAVAVALFAVSAAMADDTWLSGGEIKALLSGASVMSADPAQPWTQTFSTSGITNYTNPAGEPSDGAWIVQGDRYCSLWPPSNDWDCYRVRTEIVGGKTHVIWVTNSGFETAGVIVPGL